MDIVPSNHIKIMALVNKYVKTMPPYRFSIDHKQIAVTITGIELSFTDNVMVVSVELAPDIFTTHALEFRIMTILAEHLDTMFHKVFGINHYFSYKIKVVHPPIQ